MEQKPKLLDQVRDVARARHLSHKTEDVYHNFIKRFILFHNKRHPKEMGADEITAFLTHLAVNENVSASTQLHFRINVSKSRPRRDETCRD